MTAERIPGAARRATPSAATRHGGQLRLLLARWRQSLELHARYAALDDDHYRHVQPWPKHERPARWIIDLARERAESLSRIVEQRAAEGDRTFLEALEMMGFLANLAGLQGNERFIPLAAIENERRDVLTARTRRPKRAAAAAPTGEPTRELPRVAARAAATRRASQDEIDARIVADALRLLGWGRKWHELGDLIARLADRPAAPEVRRILREHRASIERRAGS
ncbi:MAG: hypothetical protein AB7G76_06710 [Steroidobacteraceae bacterium]